MRATWPYVCSVKNLSFLLVPKCASQTIIDAVIRTGKELNVNTKRNCEPQDFTAGFIRHPESRFLSTWCWFSTMKSFKGVNYDLPQHEFLDVIQESEDEHFAPQSYFVKNPDFLGRLETFTEDWKRLQTLFPWLTDTLNHNNKSKSFYAKLEPGIAERLKSIYSDDYIFY